MILATPRFQRHDHLFLFILFKLSQLCNVSATVTHFCLYRSSWVRSFGYLFVAWSIWACASCKSLFSLSRVLLIIINDWQRWAAILLVFAIAGISPIFSFSSSSISILSLEFCSCNLLMCSLSSFLPLSAWFEFVVEFRKLVQLISWLIHCILYTSLWILAAYCLCETCVPLYCKESKRIDLGIVWSTIFVMWYGLCELGILCGILDGARVELLDGMIEVIWLWCWVGASNKLGKSQCSASAVVRVPD